MTLNRLYVRPGANKKKRRVGRGVGSGRGKTSGRGNKGLLSRSGGGLRHGFEGGQMPLIRRIPKRGFNSGRDRVYQVINVESLNRIKNKDAITIQEMKEKGLIKDVAGRVKVLGNGDISRAVKVTAHAFSKNAAAKIKKAGGETEVIKK